MTREFHPFSSDDDDDDDGNPSSAIVDDDRRSSSMIVLPFVSQLLTLVCSNGVGWNFGMLGIGILGIPVFSNIVRSLICIKMI